MPTVVLSGVDPSAASAADWQRFNLEARRLFGLGYSCVMVSAGTSADSEIDLQRSRRLRLLELARADILALMPGWQRSPECLLEIQIAQSIGLEVLESRCLCAPLPADLRVAAPHL